MSLVLLRGKNNETCLSRNPNSFSTRTVDFEKLRRFFYFYNLRRNATSRNADDCCLEHVNFIYGGIGVNALNITTQWIDVQGFCIYYSGGRRDCLIRTQCNKEPLREQIVKTEKGLSHFEFL